MTKKSYALVLRCIVFLIAVYVYCVILDPFFFDYSPWVLPLRQLYGCLLAAGVLYVCVRLKYVGVVLYAFFTILSALLFYAYKVFGYSVSFDLIHAVLETNTYELSGFVNLTLYISLIGYLIAIPLIYIAAVYSLKWKRLSIKHLLSILAVIIAWGILYEIPPYAIRWKRGLYIKLADNTMRNDREWFMGGAMQHHPAMIYNRWRLPYSNIIAIRNGIQEYNKEIPVEEAEKFASKDTRNGEPLIFVLVIGESIRGDHVPAGGYSRNTMPICSSEPNICYYSNMHSYAKSTHQSVMGLLTGRVNDKSRKMRTSFAAILKQHGYICNLYSENTTNITDSRSFFNILGKYIISSQSCRLPIIDVAHKISKEIKERNQDRQLVIIENGTGHYSYINEDQYDTYFPCNIDWLAPRPENFQEILVNDYDNCIVSVDAFLGKLIADLRHKNAIIMYTSDHGQYLGEDGKYMHGHDDDNKLLRHVASFIWFSDEYERRHPELVAEMKAVKDKLLVHGQVYATVLKLCGIESEVPLDIGDFVNGDVREVEHNLPKSMNIPSQSVDK